ncbi:MAG: HIT family protein [Dehalococcoidia bacterium]
MTAEQPRPPEAPPGGNLQRLWTPWRSAFINEPTAPGCFLCRLAAADPADDPANLVLYRDVSAYVLLNRFPYNSAHLLVAPLSHVGDFAKLSEAVRDSLFRLAQRAVALLNTEYRPEGFNVGMNLGAVAGAGVPDHLHVHVVPRWGGDTNFMPVLAETKVLPESLEQTYARLRPHFDS